MVFGQNRNDACSRSLADNKTNDPKLVPSVESCRDASYMTSAIPPGDGTKKTLIYGIERPPCSAAGDNEQPERFRASVVYGSFEGNLARLHTALSLSLTVCDEARVYCAGNIKGSVDPLRQLVGAVALESVNRTCPI